jgi:hypothetical protein
MMFFLFQGSFFVISSRERRELLHLLFLLIVGPASMDAWGKGNHASEGSIYCVYMDMWICVYMCIGM